MPTGVNCNSKTIEITHRLGYTFDLEPGEGDAASREGSCCGGLCAQVLVQIGAFFWSALLMRALTGMGWAGTYMTGLKLLADRVDAKMMSRATAGHAASIGISGALSFACGDLIAAAAGWRAAFFVAAMSAAVAWLAVTLIVPWQRKRATPAKDGQGLYDFRPVFRNRSAMAYAIAYCIRRRVCWPVACRMDARSVGRDVADGLGYRIPLSGNADGPCAHHILAYPAARTRRRS
jgi:MFS family permease